MMMLRLHTESGHPIFRASSAFERGELRSKGHDKKSIHFDGSEENIELLLRAIMFVNPLSVTWPEEGSTCAQLPPGTEHRNLWPANMEHPINQHQKQNGPFANWQNTPTQGGKCGLTFLLPVFHP